MDSRMERARTDKSNYVNSLAAQQNGNTTMEVEIVNLGASITSIESTINLEAIQAISHKKVAYLFSVLDPDRSLEPHKPRIFKLSGACGNDYAFTWYRAYSFRLSKGPTCTIRTLNASDKPINGISTLMQVRFATNVWLCA